MLRIVLWNNFGKEIISLSDDKLSYIADYKYFKDGCRELTTDAIPILSVTNSGTRISPPEDIRIKDMVTLQHRTR